MPASCQPPNSPGKNVRSNGLAREGKGWDIPTVISTVEKKGRTVVPAEVRHKLGIQPGSALEWTISTAGVSVVKLERPKARPPGSFLAALKVLGAMPEAERSKEKVAYPAIES
jgi:AbrB family looped-hinge helix DNA binding protein